MDNISNIHKMSKEVLETDQISHENNTIDLNQKNF